MSNFDPELYLHWYRRLDENPDNESAASALSFVRQISGQLGLGQPTIHWFRKAEIPHASDRWEQSDDKQSSPEDDPTLHECPYFRLSAAEHIVHAGCTPIRSKGNILIQVGFPLDITLRVVADECYHLYQDVREGPTWREQDVNYYAAENEAAQFAESLTAAIQAFIENCRCVSQTPATS
jgi:hypothetical protein